MTSRFNPKPNVVYKRSWRGKFCPNNTQKWNSASSTQNWGGEFSIGTLGKFHPALTSQQLRQFLGSPPPKHPLRSPKHQDGQFSWYLVRELRVFALSNA